MVKYVKIAYSDPLSDGTSLVPQKSAVFKKKSQITDFFGTLFLDFSGHKGHKGGQKSRFSEKAPKCWGIIIYGL
jgi:hypothetical protein